MYKYYRNISETPCGGQKTCHNMDRMDAWHLSPGLVFIAPLKLLGPETSTRGPPAFGATLSCLEKVGLWRQAWENWAMNWYWVRALWQRSLNRRFWPS